MGGDAGYSSTRRQRQPVLVWRYQLQRGDSSRMPEQTLSGSGRCKKTSWKRLFQGLHPAGRGQRAELRSGAGMYALGLEVDIARWHRSLKNRPGQNLRSDPMDIQMPTATTVLGPPVPSAPCRTSAATPVSAMTANAFHDDKLACEAAGSERLQPNRWPPRYCSGNYRHWLSPPCRLAHCHSRRQRPCSGVDNGARAATVTGNRHYRAHLRQRTRHCPEIAGHRFANYDNGSAKTAKPSLRQTGLTCGIAGTWMKGMAGILVQASCRKRRRAGK